MLVGRSRERHLIEGLVAGARLGRSGVLLLVGEAGIGKTTLLGHARDTAGPDVLILTAGGTEVERDVPFGGLSQLLRPTEEELDALPGPQAQALGVALAMRDGPVADRLAVGAAVLTLLTRYGERRPVGVLVDDAHLLDAPSAEALSFACRRLLADQVFVLLVARNDDLGPFATACLPLDQLRGLDATETCELARRHGRRPSQEEAAWLHLATGGNPLAVLEIVAGGEPFPASLGSPGPVPDTLAQTFGRRIADLDASTRSVLVLAALTDGDLALIQRVCAGTGLDPDRLAGAERARLVSLAGKRVRFVHPLVRASAYASAYPDERRRLHAAVAAALPTSERDRRAWHLGEAALGPDDEAAAAMAGAAERAGTRGAHAVAATAYEKAAALSSNHPDRVRLLLGAGESAWRAGDPARAAGVLDRALETGAPSRTQARALRLRADIAARQGSTGQARDLFLRASDLVARTGEASDTLLLLAEAISCCFFAGDSGTALEIARRCDRIIAVEEVTTVARAVCTLAGGMALVLAGRSGTEQVRTGVRLLQSASDTERAGINPSWLMYGPLYLREADTGRSLIRQALDAGRAQSAVDSLPTLLMTLARDGVGSDHWASAQADYAEAISLARELGHVTDLAISLAGLAWLEARRGRDEECRKHAAEALDLCQRHTVGTARIWAEYALAELALVRGSIAEARERFQALVGFMEGIAFRDPDLSPLPDLVDILLRLDDQAGAREAALVARQAGEAKGLPWARARAARADLHLCHVKDLDRLHDAAIALHAQTPDLFETARTQLVYGARLRRARRRIDARPALTAALSTFEQLGATPWADLAADELAATGTTVRRKGGDAARQLTPRELQIALLLAEGRTTRETAVALFLSPKTVEYHLRHVYTKLDITTRAALVDILQRT